MRLVDQRLEIVGPAIGAVGRIPQHAVIAPVARAREIRQRHQFDRGDAGSHQVIELVDHGAVGALWREGADMGFEQHGFVPRPSAPIRRAPSVACVIDQLRSGPKRLRAESARPDRARRSRRRCGICSARRPCTPATSAVEPAVLAALHRLRLVRAAGRRASRPAPKAETTAPSRCQLVRRIAAHSCRTRKGKDRAGRRLGARSPSANS